MRKVFFFPRLRKNPGTDAEKLLDRMEKFFVQEREELVHAHHSMDDDDGRIQRAIDRADEDLATLDQMRRTILGGQPK